MANKLVTLQDNNNNNLYPTTTTDKVIYTASNNNLTNILTTLIADVKAMPLKAYPVGSIFITLTTESPADLFGGGTWAQLQGGYALITTNKSATVSSDNSETLATNHTPGNAYQGGLPNITGYVKPVVSRTGYGDQSGAFYRSGTDDNSIGSSGNHYYAYAFTYFDASRSSSAYGMYQSNGVAVVPNHIPVIVWKRIS